MAENVRPPVAIRIVRPYETEDELLEHELETVGKTSVVLIGAHPRPTGVILRFEVTLASGATVLRGEGRVLAHKDNAFRGQAGLTLRFTRLDPKSKSVVDRATAMREARGTPSRPAPRAEGALADALTAGTPSPPAAARAGDVTSEPTASEAAAAEQEAAVASARASAREKANATARANAKRTGRPMALTPPPAPVDEPPPLSAADVPPADVLAADVPPADLRPAAAYEPQGHVEQATAAAEAPQVLSAADVEDTPAPIEDAVTAVPGEVAFKDGSPLAPHGPHAPRPSPSSAPAAPSPRNSKASAAPIEPPPDRAELLARLRDRAGNLAPERVQEILAARR